MSEHLQKFSPQKNHVNFSVIVIPFNKQNKILAIRQLAQEQSTNKL
jgi:hypothetical protein